MCVHECGRNEQMHGRSFGEQTTVTFEYVITNASHFAPFTHFEIDLKKCHRFYSPKCLCWCHFPSRSSARRSWDLHRCVLLVVELDEWDASVEMMDTAIDLENRPTWSQTAGGKTDTKSVDAQSENARQNLKIQIKISNLSTKNFWPNGDMQVSCTECWLVWQRFVRFVCRHFSFHAQIVHRLKFAVKIFVAHDRFGWSKMP